MRREDESKRSKSDLGGEIPVIQVTDLTKWYGKVRGIEGVTLTVGRGEIFGFLGPNGAGKTTTIRLLLGLLRPTRGEARVLGARAWGPQVQPHERLGYLPGEIELWGECTGEELLSFLGRFRPRRPPSQRQSLLERLAFSEHDLRRRVSSYSTGMRQKLSLVLAMQHDPELLILDEPTTGLDPLVRETLFEIFEELRRRGCTLFISSHNLSEVERLCDRAGIVRDGRLVTVERIDELKKRLPRRVEVTFARPPPDRVFALPGVTIREPVEGRLVMQAAGDLNDLLRALARCEVADLSLQPPSLEEVFLHFYRGEEKGEQPS
ncbi:MAG: ABC transporter ATP-binding protein [Planctomycetota bacterium]